MDGYPIIRRETFTWLVFVGVSHKQTQTLLTRPFFKAIIIIISYNKHVCVCVCVCVCMRNGRSPEVIRPPSKCYFFLWGMATVGQTEGVQ